MTRSGASGLLASAFVLAFWMTPIALDHAASEWPWELAKIISVASAGFAAGAIIYYSASLFLEKKGAAVRYVTQFREYALARKQADANERIKLLAACDLMRHLPAEQIEQILPCIQGRHLGQSEILFKAGDPGDAQCRTIGEARGIEDLDALIAGIGDEDPVGRGIEADAAGLVERGAVAAGDTAHAEGRDDGKRGRVEDLDPLTGGIGDEEMAVHRIVQPLRIDVKQRKLRVLQRRRQQRIAEDVLGEHGATSS